MRKPLSGAHPDRAVSILEERFGVHVVPDEAVLISDAVDSPLVDDVDAMISAGPKPSQMIGIHKLDVIRCERRARKPFGNGGLSAHDAETNHSGRNARQPKR